MYKLYTGNETYISLLEAKKCLKSLCIDDVEYISLDVEKTKAGKILEILSSNSLFNPQRVIFLKRVYRNKEKNILIEYLLDYHNRDTKDHIIIWEDQKISSVTKYIKFFKKNNLLEEYTKLNKRHS
jgi:DNA polymerase III delta subunit